VYCVLLFPFAVHTFAGRQVTTESYRCIVAVDGKVNLLTLCTHIKHEVRLSSTAAVSQNCSEIIESVAASGSGLMRNSLIHKSSVQYHSIVDLWFVIKLVNLVSLKDHCKKARVNECENHDIIFLPTAQLIL
jgi:hypothetical protein